VTAFVKVSTKHDEKKTSNGAIAQLGEHLLCKQGVGGSIPPGSTILKLMDEHKHDVFIHEFFLTL
jgi:hypothetical protein